MSKANLHCGRCGRVTLHPAVVIGARPFGRVCARKAGLVELEARRWRLTAAQLCVEVWRSENANNRRLEGATR